MKTKIFVINPVNGKAISPEKWIKSKNPTAAEWLVVENVDYGFKFKIHKKDFGYHNWSEAIEAAKSAGGRLPNRFEMITLSDAIYTANLNKVIEIIEGEELSDWCWTGEEENDPLYSSRSACISVPRVGYVNSNPKTAAYQVRVVSDL